MQLKGNITMDSIPWNKFIGGIANLADSNYEQTNIKCPKCEQNLYKRVDVILTSYPPKYRYECKTCGWSGVK